MALARQIVQTGFRFGIEEGIDPHQVPFGVLTRAENACWAKSGRIEKRAGVSLLSSSISGGGSLTSATRLFARGTELCMVSGQRLYSLSATGWLQRQKVPEVGVETQVVHDSTFSLFDASVARLSNGNLVYAWATDTIATGGKAYYLITDSDGAIITPPIRIGALTTVQAVKVVASGTNYLVVYKAGAFIYTFDGATDAALVGPVGTGANQGVSCLDAQAIGSDFILAFATAGGGITLQRYPIVAPSVPTATGVVTGEASLGVKCIGIDGTAGESLYVSYIEVAGNLVRYATANPSTLVQVLAPTTIETLLSAPSDTWIGITRASSTTATVVWSVKNTQRPFCDLRSCIVTTAGVVNATAHSEYLQLHSKPFVLNGTAYVVAANWVESTGVTDAGWDAYVVDVTTVPGNGHRMAAKIDTLSSGGFADQCLPNVVTISTTEAVVVSPFVSSIRIASSFGDTLARNGFRRVRVTAGASLPADTYRAFPVGPELCVMGGVVTAYDGAEPVPWGFAHAAYINTSMSTVSAVGGTMATGVYLYSVVPERRSAAGILHRGPAATTWTTPSVTGPTGSVTLVIAPVWLGLPFYTPTLLAIYRSLVDGSTLQRRTYDPTNLMVSGDFVDANASVTAVDAAGDADYFLSTRPVLYTVGGELDDFQPPALLTGCWHKNRIWGVGPDGYTIWFSKDYTSNVGTAPGFHPTLTMTLDVQVTALASLDEKLIVFTESDIFYVLGDGPAPNGLNSDLTSPNGIASDVGCTNPRSVISTKEGVYFQSSKGLHLLTRGLEVVWVGKPVQDALASYPNITSAVLVPKKSEIRFTCNNAAGSAGRTLVWNYVEKQWSVFVYVAGAAIADACLVNDVYTFVTPAGVVYQEQDASWLDAGAYYSMALETAWVSAAGPLAYHSVREFALQGISNSNHDLKIEVAFDGDTSYAQSKTFLAGSAVTAIGPLEECSITIGTRRKCQHIRFRITDLTPTTPGTYPVGTGRGPSFDTMGVEVGQKQGFAVGPATKKG